MWGGLGPGCFFGTVCATHCVTRAACAQRVVCVAGGPCAQRLVSLGGPVRKALCHREACAQRRVSQRGRGVCLWLRGESNGLLTCQSWAQIPGGALCTTPCVTRGGQCATPCVNEGKACAQCLVLFGGGPAHNASCHAQRLVSPGGHTPPYDTRRCAQRLVSRNALCHRGGGRCTTPCVTGGACARRLVSPEGGPVHNALCDSGGGACACGLVASAADFLPVSHGLKSQGRPCAQRLVSRGRDGTGRDGTGRDGTGRDGCATPCVTALCHRGEAGAQRLVSPRGGLCTTPCVAQRLVSAEGGPAHNALCRRGCLCTTPCVGACACGLVVRGTDFLPVSHWLKSQAGSVHNALCHGGVASAQRLVSPRRGLCTTPCVTLGGPCAQPLVSAKGGPCTTPCVAGGACAQRLVSGRVPVA